MADDPGTDDSSPSFNASMTDEILLLAQPSIARDRKFECTQREGYYLRQNTRHDRGASLFEELTK